MSGYLAALPSQWCEIIREKGFSDGNFRNLCILMALYAHRNAATGQCSPSVDRLAVMLGMGKSGVLEGIQNLQETRWLTYQKTPTANNREKYEYDLTSYADENGALVFSSNLLTGGLWAFLAPSERKTWLMLRAHAVHGANVVPDAFCGSDDARAPSEDILDSLSDGWHWSQFWFVPEHVLEPEAWAEQLRMTRRTFTDAVNGLAKLHMLTSATTVCEDGEQGLVLLVDPQPPDTRAWREHVSNFHERLSGLKRKQSSTAAKRLVASVKNQQKDMVAQRKPTSAPQGTDSCTSQN